jgi:hypothetical protein
MSHHFQDIQGNRMEIADEKHYRCLQQAEPCPVNGKPTGTLKFFFLQGNGNADHSTSPGNAQAKNHHNDCRCCHVLSPIFFKLIISGLFSSCLPEK